MSDETCIHISDQTTRELIVQYCVEAAELTSQSKEESFLLGAEWGRVYELLQANQPFAMEISYKNQHRVTALAQYLGTNVNVRPLDDDWRRLEVAVY